MIVYNGVMERLAAAGWSSYKLRITKTIPEGTMTRIRNGEPISTETIDKICQLCNCQPGDILQYIPGKREE